MREWNFSRIFGFSGM